MLRLAYGTFAVFVAAMIVYHAVEFPDGVPLQRCPEESEATGIASLATAVLLLSFGLAAITCGRGRRGAVALRALPAFLLALLLVGIVVGSVTACL